MTTTRFLWNPINQNIIREYDGAGNTIASYTTEPDLNGDVISQHRNGQSSFYHYDGQGNTTCLTDENGDVTDTYDYNAFGEVTESTGNTVNPYQYKGQHGFYKDEETGDYMAFGRVLSATEGRWLASALTDILNPFAFAKGNPVMFIAVVEEGGGNAKKLPGKQASEGGICSAAPFTLPGLMVNDLKNDQWGEGLYKFNWCQCRSAGDEGKRLHGKDIVDNKSITTHITFHKCCTIYLCGHQGGKDNLGGIYGYPPDKNEPIFILGPKAKGNESKFREAFELNDCKDCVINIFSCGGADHTKEELEILREKRKKIAELTGCKVCGSIGIVGERGASKVDQGILGSTFCPEEKDRREWINECVDSKNPIKAPAKPDGKSSQ